jgi:general secretion pathway protein G
MKNLSKIQRSIVKGQLPKVKGFTLVELLVVIAIIAILSVTAYVALGGQTAKARNSRRMQDLGAIQNALELYFVENNSRYPEALDDEALDDDLVPKYMPTLPTDPWGEDYEYVYAVSGNQKSYQLAATIENDSDADDAYEAYVIGNSDTDLIGRRGDFETSAGVTAEGEECSNGTSVEDKGTCLPYMLE